MSDRVATYKYIYFRKLDKLNGKMAYMCHNKKSNNILGDVRYNKKWKEYEFVPGMGTGFSEECLRDIRDFIQKANKSGE